MEFTVNHTYLLYTAKQKDLKMILIVLFLLTLGNQLPAQNGTTEERDPDSIILPEPDPFSLDALSAIYCIDLLRNNQFIETRDSAGKPGIVKVTKVWSYFLGLDESYPEGHRLRYDIIVNEVPLDWDNSFIEYGGDMLNLRLLFLYRNQYPSPGLIYNNNP